MCDMFIKFVQVQFPQKIADLYICELRQVHNSLLPDFFFNQAQYFVRNISRFLRLNLVEDFIEVVRPFIGEICRLGGWVLIVGLVALNDNVFEVPAFYATHKSLIVINNHLIILVIIEMTLFTEVNLFCDSTF